MELGLHPGPILAEPVAIPGLSGASLHGTAEYASGAGELRGGQCPELDAGGAPGTRHGGSSGSLQEEVPPGHGQGRTRLLGHAMQ